MDIEQLKSTLNKRLSQLNVAEKEMWANLNYTVGMREEVERTIGLLEGKNTGEGEGSPQEAFQLPEQFEVVPVPEETDAGQA